MPVFAISATSGEGIDAWVDWLKGKVLTKVN